MLKRKDMDLDRRHFLASLAAPILIPREEIRFVRIHAPALSPSLLGRIEGILGESAPQSVSIEGRMTTLRYRSCIVSFEKQQDTLVTLHADRSTFRLL